MNGLARGTVKLVPHQREWDKNAALTIKTLKHLLGDTAIDIQHIGSTAIASISAKPIIDIAVGVGNLQDMMPYVERLGQNGIIFDGEDEIAKCFCHELEHLDGMIFLDKAIEELSVV